MTGPLSLVLLFAPMLLPPGVANALGTPLVWGLGALCVLIAAYRAWLSEHRLRLAERLDPLIEDVRLMRDLWLTIEYDYASSTLVRLPLAGFEVKEWEPVHRQLLRLMQSTQVHGPRVQGVFLNLGISAEQVRFLAVLNDQNARINLTAPEFTKLLDAHATMLAEMRARILR
jgi:hypothetical protein